LKKKPHFLNKYRQHIAMTMNKFSGDVFTKIMWNGWLDILKNGLFADLQPMYFVKLLFFNFLMLQTFHCKKNDRRK
jgi:hypothetical protein